MIKSQDIIQLRAFARQDGLLLALFWAISFAATIYLPDSSVGQFLILATPFFIWWRLASFRNSALNGVISYLRAWAYTMHTIFYAALVFAVVQYIYFRYLDNGRFVMQLTQALDIMRSISQDNPQDTQMPLMLKKMEASVDELRQSTPIEITFIFMMMHLWMGFFISFVIAAFGKKSDKRITTND